MSGLRLARLFGFVLLMGCLLLPTALFAQNPITITIDQTGFDPQGHVVEGAWFPVTVTIENNGGDVQGILSANSSFNRLATGQVLDLPGGARKQVTLFIRASDNIGLDIVFKRDNETLARANTRITLHSRTEHLIGLVGTQPAALAGLDLTDTTLVTIDPATFLINDATLLNFKVLAMSNFIPTPEQTAALERWVRLGGILLIDAGTSSDGVAPEFNQLVPATVDMQAGTQSANLTARQLVAQSSEVRPIQIRPLQPASDATVVLSDTNRALLVKRDLGLGSVMVSGFDLASVPIERNKPSIWSALIKPMGVNQWVLANQEWRRVNGIAGLPSTATMFGLLAAYILMIGPINYFLLRKFDRREWAWFSIPLMVLIFVGIAYLGGKDLRSINLSVGSINVVDGSAGSNQARMTSLVTVNSGRRSTWSATLAKPFIAGVEYDSFSSDSSNDVFDQRSDGTTAMTNWNSNVGSTKSFVTLGSTEQPYQFEVTNLVWDENRSSWQSGTIKNVGKQRVEAAMLVYKEMVWNLPALEPNQTITIDSSLSFNVGFPFTNLPLAEKQNTVLQSVYEQMYMLDQTGSLPANSVYSLPRIIIVDETPRLPLTFEEDVAQTQYNIYHIYLPAEGIK